MAFQLKLLAFSVFLLLSLRLCHGKNVTVKVIGQIHCQDCIRHEFSNSPAASLGINIFIQCKSGERETKRQGNGSVDREGKFNVTLPAEITEDGYSIDRCFAKLQSRSTLPCPIQSAQTASVKILITTEDDTINRPMIIKFSPITCQSTFFFPLPKFTFSHTLPPAPPIEYAPPPSEALPPLFPPENSTPPKPAPTSQSPPNPTVESPSPSPSQIYNTPPRIPPFNEPIPPPFFKQLPKPPPPTPKAFHRTPFVPTPILPPIPLPHHKEPHCETPTAPPITILKPPTTFAPSPSPSPSPYSHPPLPKLEKPLPPPPNRRKSNPIPRAPPVPQLPPIPPVPRKYFNPPNSKSQPPQSS